MKHVLVLISMLTLSSFAQANVYQANLWKCGDFTFCVKVLEGPYKDQKLVVHFGEGMYSPAALSAQALNLTSGGTSTALLQISGDKTMGGEFMVYQFLKADPNL